MNYKSNSKSNSAKDEPGFIESLSNNKLLIGLVAIFVNIGSRYIELKLTPNQEALMRNIGREVLIFTITLLYTRDLINAILITAAFIILSQYAFNEQSSLCILPEKYKNLHSAMDLNKDGVITEDEILKAEKILEKAKNQQNLHNKVFMLNNLS